MYTVYSTIRREQEIRLTIIFHAKVRTAGTDVEVSYRGWLTSLSRWIFHNHYQYHRSRITICKGLNCGPSLYSVWHTLSMLLLYRVWRHAPRKIIKISPPKIKFGCTCDWKLWSCKAHGGWLAIPPTPWISPWTIGYCCLHACGVGMHISTVWKDLV